MNVLDLIRKLHQHSMDDFVFGIDAELTGVVVVNHKDVTKVTIIEATPLDDDHQAALKRQAKQLTPKKGGDPHA